MNLAAVASLALVLTSSWHADGDASRWVGQWTGTEYKWDGSVSHHGAYVQIEAAMDGWYWNGRDANRHLIHRMHDSRYWYGNVFGQFNMHCTIKDDSNLFCSFRAGWDYFFIGSKPMLRPMSDWPALTSWVGQWTGTEYNWDGSVSHHGAYVQIGAGLDGLYWNGRDANRPLTHQMHDTRYWYGNVARQFNVHCSIRDDGNLFCSFRANNQDYFFTGSKVPAETQMSAMLV